MSHNIPSELKYATTHEWLREEDDGTFTVGITEHAQALLGDLVFVELPEVGIELTTSQEVGVVESVKAASDIYSPISGEIVAINEALSSTPELINSDPYGEGWIFRIQANDAEEINDLLDAEMYEEQISHEK